MSIKALPTRYKGIEFKSRLEARWAIFFEQMGYKWIYEPEGFALPSGNYLPDFRISMNDWNCYVEIKPSSFVLDSDPRHNEMGKIHTLVVIPSDVPGAINAACYDKEGDGYIIVLLTGPHKFFPFFYVDGEVGKDRTLDAYWNDTHGPAQTKAMNYHFKPIK